MKKSEIHWCKHDDSPTVSNCKSRSIESKSRTWTLSKQDTAKKEVCENANFNFDVTQAGVKMDIADLWFIWLYGILWK